MEAVVFFDVIIKPQTWRNVAYLLLAFPLGIFYFVLNGIFFGLAAGLVPGFGIGGFGPVFPAESSTANQRFSDGCKKGS